MGDNYMIISPPKSSLKLALMPLGGEGGGVLFRVLYPSSYYTFLLFTSFPLNPESPFKEALMNSLKSGWGAIGLDLNSG